MLDGDALDNTLLPLGNNIIRAAPYCDTLEAYRLNGDLLNESNLS